mmetsp:Transcript_39462/g.68830  ORF Transcript_39462/g.68830 Transcript_39462/m.68830 type:complete len:238 (-) Transcript_39462:765-1478(-)
MLRITTLKSAIQNPTNSKVDCCKKPLSHDLLGAVGGQLDGEEARVRDGQRGVARAAHALDRELLRPGPPLVGQPRPAPDEADELRALGAGEPGHRRPEPLHHLGAGRVPLVPRVSAQVLQVHVALPRHQHLELLPGEQLQHAQRGDGGQAPADGGQLPVQLVQAVPLRPPAVLQARGPGHGARRAAGHELHLRAVAASSSPGDHISISSIEVCLGHPLLAQSLKKFHCDGIDACQIR